MTSVIASCSSDAAVDEGPRVAFLFDGSSGDADEVSGPALAGLRFAALGPGRLETIQPLNVGLGADATEEMLDELADDRSVVAAVVAPWTSPPEGAVERLVAAGVPVVSLSWAWGPAPGGTWRSLAVDRTREAELLLGARAGVGEAGGPPCIASDRHPMSAALAGTVVGLARQRGAAVRPAGIVDPGRPATATAVAGRLATLGCETALWTGGAEALELVLDADPDLLTVVGTSRLKTGAGIAVGVTHPARRLIAVCACADVALTTDPELQRFIHDYQTESGSAPGPFAVEAYDAGRLLLELARTSGHGRMGVAEGLRALRELDGLVGSYRFDADGSLGAGATPGGTWRASGSRWLPVGSPPIAAVPSTLPIPALLPIVRPRTRPRGRGSSTDRGEP